MILQLLNPPPTRVNDTKYIDIASIKNMHILWCRGSINQYCRQDLIPTSLSQRQEPSKVTFAELWFPGDKTNLKRRAIMMLYWVSSGNRSSHSKNLSKCTVASRITQTHSKLLIQFDFTNWKRKTLHKNVKHPKCVSASKYDTYLLFVYNLTDWLRILRLAWASATQGRQLVSYKYYIYGPYKCYWVTF